MNSASLEKLAIERADQRTEEVLGLFLSAMLRQAAVSKDGPKCELTINGSIVENLLDVKLDFVDEPGRGPRCKLTYTREEFGPWDDVDRTCIRLFDCVTTYNGDKYTDVCFDENNYLRIWT